MSTEEVSAVLRHCNERRLAVVPQGGNTGLVGGSVPVRDEVVLSLRRMDAIESLDEASGVLVCQAGCVLEALDTWLAERGFMMPLDLGAKGSCQIGGNVSTNAGGLRLLRYGSLHGTVLGLEVVLADGTVLDLMSTSRKDNTGYDLKQLFIGAEGTLGVATRCAIAVPLRPAAINVALLALDSFDAVRRTYALARARLGEVLSAAEVIDNAAVSAVAAMSMPSAPPPATNAAPAKDSASGDSGRASGSEGGGSYSSGGGSSDSGGGGGGSGSGAATAYRMPLPTHHPFYLLLETSGSDAAHDAEKLERFLEAALESGDIADGAVAQAAAQAAAMWQLRERVPLATAALGPQLKYDVSLPLGDFYRLVEAVRARVAAAGSGTSGGGVSGVSADSAAGDAASGIAGATVVGYGHLGDGNLHINIAVPRLPTGVAPSATASGSSNTPAESAASASEAVAAASAEAVVAEAALAGLTALLEPFVFEWVVARGGSISAEHGIGRSKRAFLPLQRPPPVLAAMNAVKRAFDPRGILNPGKVLP
ncbi:unnamed protein product [Phaeothamnion confervicola]